MFAVEYSSNDRERESWNRNWVCCLGFLLSYCAEND